MLPTWGKTLYRSEAAYCQSLRRELNSPGGSSRHRVFPYRILKSPIPYSLGGQTAYQTLLPERRQADPQVASNAYDRRDGAGLPRVDAMGTGL
jgi:hypothetical protein